MAGSLCQGAKSVNAGVKSSVPWSLVVTVPPRRSSPGIGECQIARQFALCVTPGSAVAESINMTGAAAFGALNTGVPNNGAIDKLGSVPNRFALTNRRFGTSKK